MCVRLWYNVHLYHRPPWLVRDAGSLENQRQALWWACRFWFLFLTMHPSFVFVTQHLYSLSGVVVGWGGFGSVHRNLQNNVSPEARHGLPGWIEIFTCIRCITTIYRTDHLTTYNCTEKSTFIFSFSCLVFCWYVQYISLFLGFDWHLFLCSRTPSRSLWLGSKHVEVMKPKVLSFFWGEFGQNGTQRFLTFAVLILNRYTVSQSSGFFFVNSHFLRRSSGIPFRP